MREILGNWIYLLVQLFWIAIEFVIPGTIFALVCIKLLRWARVKWL